jgi:hypothetical protein
VGGLGKLKKYLQDPEGLRRAEQSPGPERKRSPDLEPGLLLHFLLVNFYRSA